jgi:MFS family permease
MSRTAAERTGELDRYFRKNVVGIASVEFLWGLGLPVVVESTFLQLFLNNLGASSVAVGLIPGFFFIGCSVFALLSSYITEGMRFKRGAVILLHLISACSLLLLGGFLFLVPDDQWVLALFFSCYALFSVCVGMTLPVWLNYLVHLFSEQKSVAGLAYMMTAANAAKLASSLLLVELVSRYAFSRFASALTFIAVGLLFAAGSLLFLLTREVPAPRRQAEEKRSPFFSYLSKTFRHILANRNFLFFLGGDTEYFVTVTVISFYANYATIHCGISPAVAAGFFVMCIYLGAIATNVLCGVMGAFSLKNKAIVSKLLALTAVILLVFSKSTASFFTISVLFGASRGVRNVAYAPSVKKLAGLPDATGYFAVAPVLTLPFAVLLPLAAGHFIDGFAHLQADAYRAVFAVASVLLLASLVSIIKADFNR